MYNDKLWFWWYDEMIRFSLLAYFTPNFIIGSADDWVKLGVTLNGAKPICKP